jgi:RNA polymerase sigma-70 factor, ECF subfamily
LNTTVAGTAADEDAALLAHIAAGNEAALGVFYRRHEGRVYAFALKRVSIPADAAEVLNEVMLEVWRGARRFEGRARVTTWLLGITHNKSIDLLRKRGRHTADPLDFDITDDSPDPGPAAVAGAQNSEHLRHCLEKLSEAQRRVVHLTFYEDLPYDEIAEILAIPEGTVKTRMFHARKALAHCLQQLGARP